MLGSPRRLCCRRWEMRTRRGRGPVGSWGWPSSRAGRGGRLALETSCPGGCLLRHQLIFWGERAHRRALNARACLLPRGRCLGACSGKALEAGGNFPLNILALKPPPWLLQMNIQQPRTSPEVAAVTLGTPRPQPLSLPRCCPCRARPGDSLCDALHPPLPVPPSPASPLPLVLLLVHLHV